MSSELDRSSSPSPSPASTLAPGCPDAVPVDDRDIRDGVRRAHGLAPAQFAATEANVVRAVDSTIRFADHVLRTAELATAVGKEHPCPSSPPLVDRIDPVEPSRALVASIVTEPPPAGSSEPRGLTFVGVGLAVAASAAIALVIAVFPLPVRHAGEPASAAVPALPRPAETAAAQSPVPASPAAPQLAVMQTAAGSTDEDLGLGVSIRDSTPQDDLQADVTVGGLPDGAALSKGAPTGTNEWLIPASDIADVTVRPPRGFAGTMELAIALRIPPDRITDRRSIRLEWTRVAASEPPAPVAAAAAPLTPVPAETTPAPTVPAEPRAAEIPGFTPRKLDAEEIATLTKRGEDLFVAGDIASARLMFQRAAEAADPRAALALAATYDPIVLNDLGVHGVAPNLSLARAWYEKAKTFGSPEAPHRLELLASRH